MNLRELRRNVKNGFVNINKDILMVRGIMESKNVGWMNAADEQEFLLRKQ